MASTASEALHVDPQRVVHETIDGETLVIDLATGTYYSLGGSGAEVWELLASGRDLGAVAAEIARRYPEAADQAQAEVRRFAGELVAEELLAPGPSNGSAAPATPAGPPPAPTFRPPVLERYTDMQYFLLLDPIHEVDDAAGWPHPAEHAEERA